MNKTVKEIYDLLYSPIITPYNLLENAKLENYSYVNYYKGNDGLVTEMKCSMEGQGETIFYYYFDEEDRLSKILMKTSTDEELVFDRQIELSNATESYKKHKEKKYHEP